MPCPVCKGEHATSACTCQVQPVGYRPSYILESESWGSMRKLVPDNHGGWTLFKCRGGQWEWDDSICDDSCVRLMEQAEKVYMSR